MVARHAKGSFQLIVITHDINFAHLLGQVCTYVYHCAPVLRTSTAHQYCACHCVSLRYIFLRSAIMGMLFTA